MNSVQRCQQILTSTATVILCESIVPVNIAAEAVKMGASLDLQYWRPPSWLLPSVLPLWATAEWILLGLMVAHGIYSVTARPIYRYGLSNHSWYSLIMTASAALVLWTAIIGNAGSARSSSQVLPWVR